METNEQQPQGGPKTETGKSITRFNAITHGILRETLTEYEQGVDEEFLYNLEQEFSPQNSIEQILLERIATIYIKLGRVAKAENEFLHSVFDPRVVTERSLIGPDPEKLRMVETTVKNEGYAPKMRPSTVDLLSSLYSRYETNLENRLFRAIREFRETKTAKIH